MVRRCTCSHRPQIAAARADKVKRLCTRMLSLPILSLTDLQRVIRIASAGNYLKESVHAITRCIFALYRQAWKLDLVFRNTASMNLFRSHW